MSEPANFYDPDAVERLRKQFQMDPQLIRVLRNQLLKRFATDERALAEFPAADLVQLHTLNLFRRCDSKIDGATKLLFKTSAGMLIESVLLRIATGRTTLCVSSQVGCAAACDFCATGKMGIARNLSVSEILDQVFQSGQVLAGEERRLQTSSSWEWANRYTMKRPVHGDRHANCTGSLRSIARKYLSVDRWSSRGDAEIRPEVSKGEPCTESAQRKTRNA